MSSVERPIDQKPVTILTGFLGAGKTTFLNHMMHHRGKKRYAIIENEYGEQGIDAELIVRPDDNIVEMNNGCLCCTIHDSLYDILTDLHDRRDDFDEIIIEATGVADPTGLAYPFISHPAVKQSFPLQVIICLVDAENIEDLLEETEEAKAQITFSDIILINKVDLISDHYVESLQSLLRQLNPLAKIYTGHKDDFPALDYTVDNDSVFQQLLTKEQSKKKEHKHDHHDHEHCDHGHDHHHHDHEHHHHHKHTSDINSLTLRFSSAFDYQKLHQHLMVFFMFQSKGLYRMKGLVCIEGNKNPYVLQSVGKRFTLDEHHRSDIASNQESVIVLIGKNLKRKGFEKLFSNCLQKEIAQQ